MKAHFHYKEEFPLEVRITLDNIEELKLLYTMFEHNVRHELSIWEGYAKGQVGIKNPKFDIIDAEEQKEVTKTLAEVYKDHESRDVLSGDIPEGTET